MLNSKNYYVFLIPYITIVCSLFHLLYYGIFGLNGLNFVSVGDIITSSAYPLFLSFLISSIGFFIGHKTYRTIKSKSNKEVYQTKTTFFENIFKFLLFCVMSTIIVYVSYLILGQLNYSVIGFAIGFIAFGMLDEDKLISDDIGAYIDKEYLLMLLVYFPCISAASAFEEADKILTNKSYKYSVFISDKKATGMPNTDTLKFIGMTEHTYLFTTMNNDEIIFMKTDSLVLHVR